MSLVELRYWATAAMLLAAMVLAGVIGRRARSGLVLLALLSLVWLTVDRLWEGGVIIVFTGRNGLVASDLVGVAGLCVAAWLWHGPRR